MVIWQSNDSVRLDCDDIFGNHWLKLIALFRIRSADCSGVTSVHQSYLSVSWLSAVFGLLIVLFFHLLSTQHFVVSLGISMGVCVFHSCAYLSNESIRQTTDALGAVLHTDQFSPFFRLCKRYHNDDGFNYFCSFFVYLRTAMIPVERRLCATFCWLDWFSSHCSKLDPILSSIRQKRNVTRCHLYRLMCTLILVC